MPAGHARLHGINYVCSIQFLLSIPPACYRSPRPSASNCRPLSESFVFTQLAIVLLQTVDYLPAQLMSCRSSTAPRPRASSSAPRRTRRYSHLIAGGGQRRSRTTAARRKKKYTRSPTPATRLHHALSLPLTTTVSGLGLHLVTALPDFLLPALRCRVRGARRVPESFCLAWPVPHVGPNLNIVRSLVFAAVAGGAPHRRVVLHHRRAAVPCGAHPPKKGNILSPAWLYSYGPAQSL